MTEKEKKDVRRNTLLLRRKTETKRRQRLDKRRTNGEGKTRESRKLLEMPEMRKNTMHTENNRRKCSICQEEHTNLTEIKECYERKPIIKNIKTGKTKEIKKRDIPTDQLTEAFKREIEENEDL